MHIHPLHPRWCLGVYYEWGPKKSFPLQDDLRHTDPWSHFGITRLIKPKCLMEKPGCYDIQDAKPIRGDIHFCLVSSVVFYHYKMLHDSDPNPHTIIRCDIFPEIETRKHESTNLHPKKKPKAVFSWWLKSMSGRKARKIRT